MTINLNKNVFLYQFSTGTLGGDRCICACADMSHCKVSFSLFSADNQTGFGQFRSGKIPPRYVFVVIRCYDYQSRERDTKAFGL